VRAERNNNFPAAHSNEAIYLAACDGGGARASALSFCFANAAVAADLERESQSEIVEIFQPRVSPFRMAFLCGQFCLIIRGAPVDLWHTTLAKRTSAE